MFKTAIKLPLKSVKIVCVLQFHPPLNMDLAQMKSTAKFDTISHYFCYFCSWCESESSERYIAVYNTLFRPFTCSGKRI